MGIDLSVQKTPFHRKKYDLWAVDLKMTFQHVFDVSLFISRLKKINLAMKLVFPASYLVNMGKHNGQQLLGGLKHTKKFSLISDTVVLQDPPIIKMILIIWQKAGKIVLILSWWKGKLIYLFGDFNIIS